MQLPSKNLLSSIIAIGFAAVLIFGCKGSGGGVFGPVDETAEAAKLVAEANIELTKIKVLYRENEGDVEKEGKRLQLSKAMEAKDKEQVRKVTTEIIQLIDEGTDNGQTAVDKIQQARDMQINADYQEYLRLKEEALKKQLEAFAKYRQAAQALRDNYDPLNSEQRDKVTAVFEERSESYREIMEKARAHSSEANELYKDVMRRQASAQ
jgi:hypothetical protein